MFKALKSWKVPSQWGETDFDIFFALVPSTSEDPLAQLANAPEHQGKVVVRFRRSADHRTGWHFTERRRDLLVTARLIDWLDGHPIVSREWNGFIGAETAEYPSVEDRPDTVSTPAGTPKGTPSDDKPREKGT